MPNYGNLVQGLRADIQTFLLSNLNLPGIFTSGDPDPGLPAGLLTIGESLRQANFLQTNLDAQFFATGAFLSLDDANDWLIQTAFLADRLIPTVKQVIPHRGILRDLSVSSTTLGRPRAPLNAPAAQKSHLWVVDLMLNLQLELLIPRDAAGVLVP